MKTSVRVSTLKAALIAAPKKDIRCYMVGVHLDFKHGAVNRINVVSTNGHVLSAFSEPLEYSDNPQTADFSITVPRSAVDLAIKGAGKRHALELSSLDDGRYQLGDVIFSPVDGRFTDYARVIPAPGSTSETLNFNPDYLAIGQDALALFYGDTKTVFPVEHVGSAGTTSGIGVVHYGRNDAVFVVMPIRDNELPYQGFFKL